MSTSRKLYLGVNNLFLRKAIEQKKSCVLLIAIHFVKVIEQ